jgi:hypothetical protein
MRGRERELVGDAMVFLEEIRRDEEDAYRYILIY